MKVKELDIGPPVTISPFSSVDEAIELMWEHDIRHLLVVDEGRLVGLLTDGDLLESTGMLTQAERRLVSGAVSGEEVVVADVMESEALCVTPETLATDAAHQMIYSKLTALPVVEGTRPIGIVTESDILRAFTDTCWVGQGSLQDEPVCHFASRVLKTVPSAETLAGACAALARGACRHLLVVEQNRLVGMISDWDVRSAIGRSEPGGWARRPVSDLMATGVQTLNPSDPMIRAAEMMRLDKLTAIPVATSDGELAGILTVTDVLGAFAADATIHV